MPIKEVVYIGRDNEIKLRVLSGGVAQNISSATRMTIKIDGTTVDSNVNPEVFDWATEGADGIVSLKLGSVLSTETSGYVPATLTIYDPKYTDGIVWEQSPNVANLLVLVKNP